MSVSFAVTGRGNEVKRAQELIRLVGGTVAVREVDADVLVAVRGAGRKKMEEYDHCRRPGQGKRPPGSLLLLEDLEEWGRTGRRPSITLTPAEALRRLGMDAGADLLPRGTGAFHLARTIPTMAKRARILLDSDGDDGATHLRRSTERRLEGTTGRLSARHSVNDTARGAEGKPHREACGTGSYGVPWCIEGGAHRMPAVAQTKRGANDPQMGQPASPRQRSSAGQSHLSLTPAAHARCSEETRPHTPQAEARHAVVPLQSGRPSLLAQRREVMKQVGRCDGAGVLSDAVPSLQSIISKCRRVFADAKEVTATVAKGNAGVFSRRGLLQRRRNKCHTPICTGEGATAPRASRPAPVASVGKSQRDPAVGADLGHGAVPKRELPTRLHAVREGDCEGGTAPTASGGGGAGSIGEPPLCNQGGDATEGAGPRRPRLHTKPRIPLAAKGAQGKVPHLGVRNAPDARNSRRAALLAKVMASEFARGVDEAACRSILDQIVDHTSPVSLRDVAGLSDCKQILHESVVLPARCPHLFTGLRRPCSGLLLFGPPGNGKTLLAKAVARECGTTFFNISASAVTSKWVGESEKMVRALFAVARALAPSTVFVDEVDALLQARGGGTEGEGSRRLKTEFLVQMDGAGNDHGGARVLVMAATNRPFDLDEAVIRRFPKRVLVPLPDAPAREALLRQLLNRDETRNSFSASDWQRIVVATVRYSGNDLRQLCEDIAMVPLRELFSGTAPDYCVSDITTSSLRHITIEDVMGCVARRRPSCQPSQMRALEEWGLSLGSR